VKRISKPLSKKISSIHLYLDLPGSIKVVSLKCLMRKHHFLAVCTAQKKPTAYVSGFAQPGEPGFKIISKIILR